MKIFATIRFLKKDNDRLYVSGVRPQLKVKNLFTSCSVWGESVDQVFQPDVEYRVRLEPLHLEQIKEDVLVGMVVRLNEGSRLIAEGTVLEIDDK